ncbi:40S ribosomal protein S26-like [Platysternon megacephalum]|uniref:40S ribosomal protein S26-like n=1 Tax=Platysternon megacephalum TaxID=55544 RepID=A0A4D9E1Q0_9SAUR|nr:40S ribosomal protein S26-like [Platysternon megacephalum]
MVFSSCLMDIYREQEFPFLSWIAPYLCFCTAENCERWRIHSHAPKGGAISCAELGLRQGLKAALLVKLQVEEKEGKKFEVFTAVEFKTQLVAGINYFIKVHVGNEEFLHLRVFKSLPHENKPLSLSSYQSSKTKHDELTYF